jgi:hypothetical protein
MHLFQEDMILEEYTRKFQVLESKTKLSTYLVWNIYVSNLRIEIQREVRNFKLKSLEKAITRQKILNFNKKGYSYDTRTKKEGKHKMSQIKTPSDLYLQNPNPSTSNPYHKCS